MNLSNALRRLAKPPRWLLRRVGLDIVRYRGEGGRRKELENTLASIRKELLASIRKELENKVASITDATITAGPFKGARLPVSESRDRGNKL
jgi:hypothetical protein